MCTIGGWLLFIGIILGLISAGMAPKKDKRFGSGFKDNKNESISDSVMKWAIGLIIPGALILWLC